MSPRIFLVAGEESGDRLGAALIGAIKRREPGATFSGVGGTHMAAEGMPSLFPLGDLAIVGFSGIVANLPNILRRIRETANAVIAARPDVLVIIDSPEFTHRVARKVRARAPSIPIVDYVCPSVWAWRPGRARAMRGYVDHVMALLPFEPDAMKRLDGPPTTFVGHPLSEKVAALRPNAEEACRRLADPPLLLVLPGSRSGEIQRMAGVFGDCIAQVADKVGALEVVVPAVPRLAAVVGEATGNWRVPARIVTEPAERDAAYRSARAALAKSGTSTLELALAGIPMVAAYKVSVVGEIIGHLMIKIRSVILANIVLGEDVVPQFIQREGTPQRLSAALLPLFSETPERRRQVEAFARLDGIMEIGSAIPSDRAAAVTLGCAARFNQNKRETVASGRPRA